MLILNVNNYEIPLKEFHRRYDSMDNILKISLTFASEYNELSIHELIDEFRHVNTINIVYNDETITFESIQLDTIEEHLYSQREDKDVVINFFDNTYEKIENPAEITIYDFHADAVLDGEEELPTDAE